MINFGVRPTSGHFRPQARQDTWTGRITAQHRALLSGDAVSPRNIEVCQASTRPFQHKYTLSVCNCVAGPFCGIPGLLLLFGCTSSHGKGCGNIKKEQCSPMRVVSGPEHLIVPPPGARRAPQGKIYNFRATTTPFLCYASHICLAPSIATLRFAAHVRHNEEWGWMARSPKS